MMEKSLKSEHVLALLGREPSEQEVESIPLLLDEAMGTIEGYTGREFEDPIPQRVVSVAARMVVRLLNSPRNEQASMAERAAYQAGPFSASMTYTAGASGGAPWLTAVDKTTLRRYRKGGGVWSVTLG